MKEYKRPEFHFVRNPGGLRGGELADLSDSELSRYLPKDYYLQEKKKYRIKPDFILREIAGEYAIVPIGSDNAFSNVMMAPNNTAVFLWKEFEQASTIQDVVIHAIEKYDAEEEKIRESIDKFVKESMKYQVLEEVERNENEMGGTEN